MEDKFIIKNIKKRKEIGLEMLIDSYIGVIKTIVRQKLYEYSDYEEECIDDVLLAIWNNIKSYDEKQNSFKNWIVAITRYKVIDYNRKYINNKKFLSNQELHQLDEKFLQDKNTIAEEKILKDELRDEIEDLLSNLKETDRNLFKQYYLEEKSIHVVSKEFGMKKETIYNRLSRGRLRLKNILKESFE